MERRHVLAIVAATAAQCLPAFAEPGTRVHRVAVIEAATADQNARNLAALRGALASMGYLEGWNLVIEHRSIPSGADDLRPLLEDVLRHDPDVIITRGTPAALAAHRAAERIPLVIATMGEPATLVATLAQPGGTTTGVTTFGTELAAKRIEILRDFVPMLTRIGLVQNMNNPAVPPEWEQVKAAAGRANLSAELIDVRTDRDVADAVVTATQRGVQGLVVGADDLTIRHQLGLVQSIEQAKLPAVYPLRDFVEKGGLASYSVAYTQLYARLGTLAGRILGGERAGDLPFEQPTRFELVLNGRAIWELGLTVPHSLLARADEVIE